MEIFSYKIIFLLLYEHSVLLLSVSSGFLSHKDKKYVTWQIDEYMDELILRS